jgi:regulator of RNase E activity RraB
MPPVALFRKKHQADSVDPEARSPKTGIKYKDLEVVSQLVSHGADLAQPRHVLYYLFLSSAESASAAAADAEAHSFEATVAEPIPAYPGKWSVRCERRGVVLDPETIRGNGDFFDGLAAKYGGEYDGWEASVR